MQKAAEGHGYVVGVSALSDQTEGPFGFIASEARIAKTPRSPSPHNQFEIAQHMPLEQQYSLKQFRFIS